MHLVFLVQYFSKLMTAVEKYFLRFVSFNLYLIPNLIIFNEKNGLVYVFSGSLFS